ncbi:TetR family transcriptional regulator [bacterium]|nr:TetR family transcriptional regulator [bacterium]
MNIHSFIFAPMTRSLDPNKHRLVQDKACRLILESGFDAFTMQSLAQACGIAAGTIYLYFPSKEHLVNSIYADIKGEMTAAVERVWIQNPNGGLRSVLSAYLRYCTLQPERMLFVEQFHHSKFLRPEVAEAADQQFDALLQQMGIASLSTAERGLLKAHLLGSLHQTALLLIRLGAEEAAQLETRALDMTESAFRQFLQTPNP